MTLSFEAASSADLLLIRDLAEQIWDASYTQIISPPQIRYMLNWMYASHKLEAELERGVHYFLVRRAARPVGYLAWELADPKTLAYLNKLYLLPDLHGQGHGQTMLNWFFTDAQQAGATHAELRVNRANTRALKAYERAGFQIVDSHVASIGGGFVMDDFILRRAISPADSQSGTDDPSYE